MIFPASSRVLEEAATLFHCEALKRKSSSYSSSGVIQVSELIWKDVIYVIFKAQIFTVAAKLKVLADTQSSLARCYVRSMLARDVLYLSGFKPVFFRCLGESCNVVLLWSFTNIAWLSTSRGWTVPLKPSPPPPPPSLWVTCSHWFHKVFLLQEISI